MESRVALKVPGISSAEATKLEAANNRLFEQVPVPPGAPDLRIPVGG